MRKIKTLKKNYEFKNVLNKGKFCVGKQITVYLNKNKININENIIGIAINTKVGKAVKRNHIKRLIRECYYKNKNKLECGYNIVIIWNKKVDVKQANYHIIKKDMQYIFKKFNLLKDEKNEKNNNIFNKTV